MTKVKVIPRVLTENEQSSFEDDMMTYKLAGKLPSIEIPITWDVYEQLIAGLNEDHISDEFYYPLDDHILIKDVQVYDYLMKELVDSIALHYDDILCSVGDNYTIWKECPNIAKLAKEQLDRKEKEEAEELERVLELQRIEQAKLMNDLHYVIVDRTTVSMAMCLARDLNVVPVKAARQNLYGIEDADDKSKFRVFVNKTMKKKLVNVFTAAEIKTY